MPTNDFLPIATDPGANVQDQADYALEAVRTTGWPVGGVPPSDVWNKMLRQASSMGVALAAAIVSLTGDDMLDNGDTDALRDSIIAAIAGAVVPTYGEVNGAGAGNVAIPGTAQGALLEWCGAGGGGGSGDGGTGNFDAGDDGGDSIVAGVTAKGGGGGKGGGPGGNTFGGTGGQGGAGVGTSYTGGGGTPGQFAAVASAGNVGGTGGSSYFSGGACDSTVGNRDGAKGAGGAGGKTGNNNSNSGGGGGAGETRRKFLDAAALAALAGNIPYDLGAGGAGGNAVGTFPGGNGGPGYFRYTFFGG